MTGSGDGSEQQRRDDKVPVERLASILVAIVLPVLIVVATLAGLESFRTFADKREDRNAGKVINGRVVEGGVERVMERKLRNEPEIVILGNSLSNTDLQPPLLARGLGLKPLKVQKFSIPNSMGAHWYLILKNRVYAEGHHPKIVIILSDLQSLLALAPRSEASYLNLAVHFTDDEPVLDQLLGTRNFYMERVRENRGKLREKALTTARNAMVDLFFRHTAPSSKNDKKTENALSRVFDASKTDMRLHNNVIPIFNTRSNRDLLPFDPNELPEPDSSFMPHIAELVQSNGGHLVFLRPPMSPQLPPEFGDVVPEASEERVPAVLARYGASFFDLRTLLVSSPGEPHAERYMDATHFENVDHMNHEGSRRFTSIVSGLLDDLGVIRRVRPSAELLRTMAIVDDTFIDLPLDVEFRAPPPRVPHPERNFVQGRGELVYFRSEGFGFLNDIATIEATPLASRCSPVRVLEDGAPLPLPNVSCEEVTKHLRGRTCHTPEKLFFTTPDRTDPYLNGRHYRLALDPDRSCGGGLWLYPGDRARLAARPIDTEALLRGSGALRVAGTPLGPTEQENGALKVRVKAANMLRIEQDVPLAQLPGRGAVMSLQPRIGPTPNNVVVEIVNPTDQFVLLSSVRLLPDLPKSAEDLAEIEPPPPEPVVEDDDDELAVAPVRDTGAP
ncbi:MAG: hypothetical protein R3F59_25460 [Myxococcota bacterium]